MNQNATLLGAILAIGCGLPHAGTPGGAGANAWISTTNGTISSSDSGATVSGSISNGEIYAAHVAATNSSGSYDLGVVELVAAYNAQTPSAGQLAFVKPVGATSITLVSSIGIKGTPQSGDYTNGSANACGGIVLEIVSGSTASVYTATSPFDCETSKTNTAPAGSSFDLHLNSISVLDSTGTVVAPGAGTASWAYYKVSGTFNATLVNAQDASAPGVNVSLSF